MFFLPWLEYEAFGALFSKCLTQLAFTIHVSAAIEVYYNDERERHLGIRQGCIRGLDYGMGTLGLQGPAFSPFDVLGRAMHECMRVHARRRDTLASRYATTWCKRESDPDSFSTRKRYGDAGHPACMDLARTARSLEDAY